MGKSLRRIADEKKGEKEITARIAGVFGGVMQLSVKVGEEEEEEEEEEDEVY